MTRTICIVALHLTRSWRAAWNGSENLLESTGRHADSGGSGVDRRPCVRPGGQRDRLSIDSQTYEGKKNQARVSGSPKIRRTGQLLHPVAGGATRSFLEVYATGEQRTVRGAQREGAARFELVARRIIAKPRKLERKQGVVQRPGCLN